MLAGQALEQKHDVRILLCDAAGDMAANGHVSAALKPRNLTPQHMLQGLIKAGGKVAAAPGNGSERAKGG